MGCYAEVRSCRERHPRCCSFCLAVCLSGPGRAAEARFRNVVVLVADGAGSAHTALARWYNLFKGVGGASPAGD